MKKDKSHPFDPSHALDMDDLAHLNNMHEAPLLHVLRRSVAETPFLSCAQHPPAARLTQFTHEHQALPIGRHLHAVLGRAHLHQPLQAHPAPLRPRPRHRGAPRRPPTRQQGLCVYVCVGSFVVVMVHFPAGILCDIQPSSLSVELPLPTPYQPFIHRSPAAVPCTATRRRRRRGRTCSRWRRAPSAT